MAAALENRTLFFSAETGRQTLQSVLTSLPAGVLVVNEKREIVLSNAAARRLLGIGEPTPYQILHTISGTPYAVSELPHIRALTAGEDVSGEDVTVIDSHGFRTVLIANAVPVRDNAGKVISAVSVFQDVTDLRDLEVVLQDSLRETTTLYEASRAIAAETEINGVMGVLLTQLNDAVRPRYLFMVLRDSANEVVQVVRGAITEEGIELVTLDATRLPVPRWTLRDNEQASYEDVAHHPELRSARELREMDIASFVTFPLQARLRTAGWLIVAFGGPRSLDSEERRFINTLADQTAVAVESIRLSLETQQALAETTLLYEASYNINRADSIPSVVSLLRDQLRSFNPTQIDIFLIDASRNNYDDYRVNWALHWDNQEGSVVDSVAMAGVEQQQQWETPAIIEAESYYIENLTNVTVTRLQQAQSTPGWGSFSAQASVPLQVKERITGRIIIGYDKPHKFSRLERQFLTALAGQAAIVIDNVGLVQQTQESLEETATLYQSSRQIADAPDLNNVLTAIIDHAAPSFVHRALMLRNVAGDWRSTDTALELVAEWGASVSAAATDSKPILEIDNEDGTDEVMQVPAQLNPRYNKPDYPLWSLLANEEMVWLPDVDAYMSSMDPYMADYLREAGVRGLVILPLRTAGRTIGALVLMTNSQWAQSEREVRLFSSLADQVAIAVESRTLLEQTDRRARQLQTSAQVSRAANSILNLDELFNVTVNLIKDSFNYDHVQIFLVNDDGDDALLVASTGEAGKQLLAIHHHLPVGSKSIIGQVTENGAPTVVLDTQARDSVHRPNPYLPKTRSEMALPLTARQRILGALDVQSNNAGTFTQDDISVLGVLADQIAVAIDNARLFEVSSRRADEMRFLFDATRAATTAMAQMPQEAGESNDALKRVSDLLMGNLHADAAMVLLLDNEQQQLFAYNQLAPETNLNLAMRYDAGASVFKLVLEGNQPALINDVVRMSRQALPGLRETLPGVGSAVFVPLATAEKVVGILGALNVERNGFTEDSTRLLQTLAPSLAAIIQNAQLLSEVQRANARLRELDKLKSQFLANMSHELRTPLNSIIGFSRVILKGIDGPLTDMQTQDLNTIHESGKHLLGLVNDILDQAKIEAGKMELQFASFSILDLIKGVMSTASGLIKDKPVRIRQELDATIDQVWGDEFRTRQVLLNLVSNAAKFTASGSITLSAFPVQSDEGRPMVQIS
ncbi:MAG: GAF domain-containing protein [Anaerolineae bacterium]